MFLNDIQFIDPEQSLLLWGTSCRPPEIRQEALHRLLAQAPALDWERLLRLAAINHPTFMATYPTPDASLQAKMRIAASPLHSLARLAKADRMDISQAEVGSCR